MTSEKVYTMPLLITHTHIIKEILCMTKYIHKSIRVTVSAFPAVL